MYSYLVVAIVASMFYGSFAADNAENGAEKPVNPLCTTTVSLLAKGLTPEEMKNELISTIHKGGNNYYSYYGDYYEPYGSYGSYGYDSYSGGDYYKPNNDYYSNYKPHNNYYGKPSTTDYYGGGKPHYGGYSNNQYNYYNCNGYHCKSQAGEPVEAKASEAVVAENPVKRQAEVTPATTEQTSTVPQLSIPNFNLDEVIANLISAFNSIMGSQRNMDSETLVDQCSQLPHYQRLSEFLQAFSELVAHE